MEQLDFFNTLEQTKPICPICGNGFEKSKFHPKQVYCSKKCLNKVYNKSYYEANKDRKKAYDEANKDRKKAYNKAWYEANKDKVKKYRKVYGKIYKEANKNKIRKTKRLYRELNKDKINVHRRAYSEKRYKTDINFKLKLLLRDRIRSAIKRTVKRTVKGKKCNNTIKLLGCTIQEAREYIEKQFKKGMTWENHSYNGWHIDHIIPCALFDLTDPEQQKKCFHYTNLQPLWAKENMSKGAKIL